MIPLAATKRTSRRYACGWSSVPRFRRRSSWKAWPGVPESDEFRRPRSQRLASMVRCKAHPSDFGLWCLEQAVSMANERPLAAEHLLEMAFQAHRDHSGPCGPVPPIAARTGTEEPEAERASGTAAVSFAHFRGASAIRGKNSAGEKRRTNSSSGSIMSGPTRRRFSRTGRRRRCSTILPR